MEKILAKQQSYIITTLELDKFLCPGEQCRFEITTNIQKAARISSKKKAKSVLDSFLEENPNSDLTEMVPITITYSIVFEKMSRKFLETEYSD